MKPKRSIFQQLCHVFCSKHHHRFPHQKQTFSTSHWFWRTWHCNFSVFYTKKSKNEKRLLEFNYFKFNFSVAGLKLQPFFQSSKWLKNGSDFCPKRRMRSRTKLFFQFFSPWSNTAHHLMSHIFGNKSDHKFLHQKDHILVIRLIVKKDFGKSNGYLEMETTDFETEKVCPQS